MRACRRAAGLPPPLPLLALQLLVLPSQLPRLAKAAAAVAHYFVLPLLPPHLLLPRPRPHRPLLLQRDLGSRAHLPQWY